MLQYTFSTFFLFFYFFIFALFCFMFFFFVFVLSFFFFNFIYFFFFSLPNFSKHDLTEIGKLLTDAVVRKMQLQCEVLVSTKFNSILRRKGKEDLLNFSWDALLQEWEKQAPIFFNFLKSSVSTPAVKNAQPIADKTIAPVCMAGAILLKTRSQSMSALQRIVSMLLNAGHVSKQVTWEKCIHIQRQYDELNAFLCRPMCDCSELVCACHTPSQFGLLIRQQPATPVNLWSGRQLLKRASKTCILWVCEIPGSNINPRPMPGLWEGGRLCSFTMCVMQYLF